MWRWGVIAVGAAVLAGVPWYGDEVMIQYGINVSIRFQPCPPFRVQSRPSWKREFGLIRVVHRRDPRP